MQAMRSWVCLAAAVVGACASPDPGVGVAYYLPTDEEEPCPANGCGGNSPVIDGVYFWRLHFGGKANPEGVRITSITAPNGGPMNLELVQGDRLRGGIGTFGYVEHTALIGTKIRVSMKVKGQLRDYEILIKGVAPSVPIGVALPQEWFWVKAPLAIEAYDFYYRPLFGPDQRLERPLCSEADGDPTMLRALVFGGDIYHPVTKRIEVGLVTEGWMNIACADSATYKMHKIGHTTAAGGRLGIATSVAQRRAMLNAWTSNVCGTGDAFTKQGERIKLRESFDMLLPGSAYLDPLDEAQTESIEAIWSETGAVCLNTHRLDGTPDEFDIPCREALPSCDEWLGNWTAHGHVVTGNPYPTAAAP